MASCQAITFDQILASCHDIQICGVAAVQQNPFDATPPLKNLIQAATQSRLQYIQQASPAGHFLLCTCRTKQCPGAIQYGRQIQQSTTQFFPAAESPQHTKIWNHRYHSTLACTHNIDVRVRLATRNIAQHACPSLIAKFAATSSAAEFGRSDLLVHALPATKKQSTKGVLTGAHTIVT